MRILDRILLGKVIKDFGVLEEKSIGIGKIRKSALLVESHGRLRLVLKHSIWGFLGGSVSYDELTLESAYKLREHINESEQIARNLPPIAYKVADVARRNVLITATIASVINLVAPNDGLVFLTTLIAGVVLVNQYIGFRDHPDVTLQAKWQMRGIIGFTLLISVAKFAWLGFVN